VPFLTNSQLALHQMFSIKMFIKKVGKSQNSIPSRQQLSFWLSVEVDLNRIERTIQKTYKQSCRSIYTENIRRMWQAGTEWFAKNSCAV